MAEKNFNEECCVDVCYIGFGLQFIYIQNLVPL